MAPKGVFTNKKSRMFEVSIDGQYLPIKSYSGGYLASEEADASTGSSQTKSSTSAATTTGDNKGDKDQPKIGHNYITELTLVAYIVPGQTVLTDMAHDVAVLGKSRRGTVTITEMAKDKSSSRTFVYDQCLMTSLSFYRLRSYLPTPLRSTRCRPCPSSTLFADVWKVSSRRARSCVFYS